MRTRTALAYGAVVALTVAALWLYSGDVNYALRTTASLIAYGWVYATPVLALLYWRYRSRIRLCARCRGVRERERDPVQQH
jgi:hypothetical protein